MNFYFQQQTLSVPEISEARVDAKDRVGGSAAESHVERVPWRGSLSFPWRCGSSCGFQLQSTAELPSGKRLHSCGDGYIHYFAGHFQ